MGEVRTVVRRGVAVAAGVLLGTIGFVGLAPRAGADVLPVDKDGCPAGGDPESALPCVTFEVGCPKFGLGVRLANASAASEDAEFLITTPTGSETFVVGANESIFPNVHIGEDQTVHITIEELVTGLVFVDEDFTRDCTDPGASVAAASCETGGSLVSLTNDGIAGVDFVIDVYDDGADEPTRTFEVAEVGHEGATQLVPAVGDGSLRIVVTALTAEGPPPTEPTAEVVADLGVPVDCEHPAPTAEVTHACSSGITVGLATTDAEGGETTFVVTITDADGDVVYERTVTIDGAGADQVTYADPAEDTDHSVVVTADGVVLAEDDVLVDCEEVLPTATTRPPTQVAGVQIPRQLPRTGSDATPSTLLAVGLVLSGVGLVGFGAIPTMTAKRRPAHARR